MVAAAPDRPESKGALLRLFVAPLFFVSGATGLIYEVAWTRLFTHVFGSTTWAVSAVLASFMGGLALGAIVLGRLADRRPRSLLLLYAVLELGIAGAALLLPSLIRALGVADRYAYQELGTSEGTLVLVKLALSFAVLLLPTFLMGGTLPTLSRLFVARPEQTGRRVGLLYALNTLGAALGCFVTGFYFIELLGVALTVQVAAAINVALGLVFLVLHLVAGKQGAPSPVEPASEPSPEPPAGGHGRLVLFAFGISGFVALSYEILWTRLLVFALQTTVFAFSAMLTTFLVGLGAGSLLFAALDRRGAIRNYLRAFGLVELLIGLLGLLSLFGFGAVDAEVSFYSQEPWGAVVLEQLGYSALIMLPATLLLGVTFPLVTRICADDARAIGATVGKAYGANTLGAILGSLLTGFVLVRLLGTQYSLYLMVLLALATGTTLLVASAPRRRRFGLLTAGAAWLAALVVVLATPGDYMLRIYNAGELVHDSRAQILHAYEGVETITTVHRYSNGDRVLSTGSINVAGTGFTLRTTQKMQAHVPMLLHPAPRDVLQVGFGSGETSHILTTYDTEHVDVAEISAGVLATSAEYFADINHDVVKDPKFRAFVMDGANYMAVTPRRYDVIMNDSIWPFLAGNSGLYTREYFEAGKRHLKPGGLMTSWFPLLIPGDGFRTLLETFHQVFPHVTLWVAATHPNKHALVVGSLEPLEIDLPVFLQRFERYARDDLAEIALDDPVYFLDCLKTDETAFAEHVQDAEVHTTDHPVLEFAPNKQWPGEGLGQIYGLLASWNVPVTAHIDPKGAEGWDELEGALGRARLASKLLLSAMAAWDHGGHSFGDLLARARRLAPNHPGVRFFDSEREELANLSGEDLAGLAPRDLLLLATRIMDHEEWAKAREVLERAVALDPDMAEAQHDLGVALARQGRHAEAQEHLRRAIELNPRLADAHYNLALSLEQLGDLSGAEAEYREALRLRPEHAAAHHNLGMIAAYRGDTAAAREHLREAVRLAPANDVALVRLAELLMRTGDMDEALGHLERAVQLNPTSAPARMDLGAVLAEKKRYPEALRQLRQAVQLAPDDKKAQELLSAVRKLAE